LLAPQPFLRSERHLTRYKPSASPGVGATNGEPRRLRHYIARKTSGAASLEAAQAARRAFTLGAPLVHRQGSTGMTSHPLTRSYFNHIMYGSSNPNRKQKHASPSKTPAPFSCSGPELISDSPARCAGRTCHPAIFSSRSCGARTCPEARGKSRGKYRGACRP